MNNIKKEAKKIIDEWENEIFYDKVDITYLDHAAFKKVLCELVFTDKELVREISKQGEDFITTHNIKLADFLSQELRNDKEFIIELINSNGYNLSVVNDEFKNDEEIVWAAIKSEPRAFEFASDRLRDNDKIVNLAVSAAINIKYVSDRFKKNKEFISNILENNYSLFSEIHPELKNDLDILSLVWEKTKEKTAYSKIHLAHKTSIFLKNIGEDIKPYFEKISRPLEVQTVIRQIDSCFNNLALQRELVSTSQTQNKKLKI
jgi:hypothetical protein